MTQRGNRRMQTFFCDEDYRAYVSLVGRWCRQEAVSVWAWCLMPNHVHLIVVPSTERGLARALGEAHRRYTRRVNFREGWRGYLWQGRFASVVMDEPHLMAAARYVERNPVRAGLAAQAEQWAWSSASAHATGRPDVLAESAWLAERTAGWVCSWTDYLRQDDDPELTAALRRSEGTGRPAGDKAFLSKIGRLLGRDLARKKPGPAPKRHKTKER